MKPEGIIHPKDENRKYYFFSDSVFLRKKTRSNSDNIRPEDETRRYYSSQG
jgi:hypothetical protein